MLLSEAAIVAIFTFAAKLLDFAAVHRAGMSEENKNRLDAVQIAGLERVERILASIERLGAKQ